MSASVDATDSTMSAMQIALSKRQQDMQGQLSLALISSATATADQVMNSAQAASSVNSVDTLATEGSLGTHINLHV